MGWKAAGLGRRPLEVKGLRDSRLLRPSQHLPTISALDGPAAMLRRCSEPCSCLRGPAIEKFRRLAEPYSAVRQCPWSLNAVTYRLPAMPRAIVLRCDPAMPSQLPSNSLCALPGIGENTVRQIPLWVCAQVTNAFARNRRDPQITVTVSLQRDRTPLQRTAGAVPPRCIKNPDSCLQQRVMPPECGQREIGRHKKSSVLPRRPAIPSITSSRPTSP
jgi:hypothetical protein